MLKGPGLGKGPTIGTHTIIDSGATKSFMSKYFYLNNKLKDTKIYGFWYQSYLQYLQGPSQGLTLLAG